MDRLFLQLEYPCFHLIEREQIVENVESRLGSPMDIFDDIQSLHVQRSVRDLSGSQAVSQTGSQSPQQGQTMR